jgi:hypothetical protein
MFRRFISASLLMGVVLTLTGCANGPLRRCCRDRDRNEYTPRVAAPCDCPPPRSGAFYTP